MKWRTGIVSWVVMICAVASAARAASPALSTVLPRGGQRGTEISIILAGDRLADAQELFFYKPGITVKKLELVDPKQVKIQLAIAPDAPIGEHPLRLRTATGVSELRTFWVGALPVVAEAEPNSDFDKPQKIKLNSTVEGVIKTEDVDYFSVDVKKGQRITAEVEGIRLGGTMFDPYVAIMNAERFEVAASDDSPLLLQDPVASFIAPADATYIVEVRDSAYGGNDASQYRVHVGTFPRPRMVFPAGGQAGEELAADFVGDAAGVIKQTLKLPTEPTPDHRVIAEQNGEIAPSPNFLRVSAFANTNEIEPNNDVKSATTAVALPAAFNGAITAKGDTDWYKFTAKKDQALDIHVYARRLRSPLDSTLAIGDSTGKNLAGNDDTAGPDSYLRFAAPADGQYTLWIADHLGGGGADYVYRIEVTPVQPRLALAIPLVAANSQERQTIVVPRGNRYATVMRATRSDFGGAVKISATNLPKGVTASEAIVADGLDVVPIVFEAAADAPTAGALADITGAAVDPNVKVTAEFSQVADLVVAGNQIAFYQANVDKLAVAVADEAPFKLTIVEPKVPLVQSGAMQLKIVAERKPGFTAPINLALPWGPPGVSAGGATIAEKATEALMPL
ncbi:MAG: hypothetical protein QOF78_532, partial [Phycisphaerales bacterium]|nr:hypothetical protein [Phycisphaerales bacterium]